MSIPSTAAAEYPLSVEELPNCFKYRFRGFTTGPDAAPLIEFPDFDWANIGGSVRHTSWHGLRKMKSRIGLDLLILDYDELLASRPSPSPARGKSLRFEEATEASTKARESDR